ncbi:MAG: M24 family metallopeptidase, partial [Elusimicrobiota bacterium]|nr:M24 family metallopeptidase [Elusimicrobiota bacterium]
MNTEKRLSELKSFMEKNDIALSIVTRPENIYYLSNFLGISWSRPISFILTSKSTGLIIPGLEEEHAKAEANVDKIYVYYEYPEKYEMSFLEYVDRILSKYPNGTKIGVEFDVMSFGLADYIRNYGYELVDIGKKITEMRFVKDKQEIELMIEAGRLVSLALSKSLEHARTGLSELEVEQYGNDAVLREIAVKYPDSVLYNLAMTTSGIVRTVMPNVSTTTRKLEQNDIIIHSRQIGFNGYRAECERTFFVGKPTDEQKELFRIATEAQRVAMDIIRPGLTAKEVDLAARKVI